MHIIFCSNTFVIAVIILVVTGTKVFFQNMNKCHLWKRLKIEMTYSWSQAPWGYFGVMSVPEDSLNKWCCKMVSFRVFQMILSLLFLFKSHVMLQVWEKAFFSLTLGFVFQLNTLSLSFQWPSFCMICYTSQFTKGLNMKETFAERYIKSWVVNYLQ